MFRRFLLPVFCCLLASAQTGPGTWKDHLSINSSNSVTKLGTRIYASYGNGLIWFDQSEISPARLNKINGLNDVGIRLLRANPYNNKLLVVYNNCNIDIVDADNHVSNYPDFKLKTFSGRKIVNEIIFEKNIAYLSCGFGIVQFDMDRMEIRETFFIGANAGNVDVLQLAYNDSYFFAATEAGLLQASRSAVLTNFRNWTQPATLPNGFYAGVVNAGGHILTGYAPSNADTLRGGRDSLYEFVNNAWVKYAPLAAYGHTIRKMGAGYDDYFYVFDLPGMFVRRASTGETVQYIAGVNGTVDYGTLRDAWMSKDHTGNVSYWLSDARFGLYQTYGSYPYFPQYQVKINGTTGSLVNNIDIFEGRVAVGASRIIEEGIGNYSRQGANFYEDGTWRYFPTTDANGQPLIDLTTVYYDRKDKTRFYTASWYYGVQSWSGSKLLASYTCLNTSMTSINGDNEPRCSSLCMDEAGNLWVGTSDSPKYLSVLRRNGQFTTFQFDALRTNRKVYVDKNNYVWMLHQREGGVTVFRHNNFAGPFENVHLTKDVGAGNLGSNSVYSILEDSDGKIWLGTAAGIRIIYSPANIFNGGDFDAQPIKIVQDGNVELLLGNEIVTAIVADGGNNKWVATQSGGVYCFSPDGITQLQHFTKENSPLYSNTIFDLNYDKTTGDVFIGTDVGIQSYRSVTVEGKDDYSSLAAYPNPVRPGYNGTVKVGGLVDNSIVKIADESGNMVWETKSAGGQIEWPVTNLSGQRVSTGVYLVYVSTTNGELRSVTKVLVVN